MTIALHSQTINHMTVAVREAMTPRGSIRRPETDTLFLGSEKPFEDERAALADFGLAKNYKLIVASFDPADPDAGPIGYDAVVTDGITQTVALDGGRLWMRDRRSPAVLLFPAIRAMIKLSMKGRLVVSEATGQFHDHGYDVARNAVWTRAGSEPGTTPVLASIGNLTTILDMRAFSDMFAAA